MTSSSASGTSPRGIPALCSKARRGISILLMKPGVVPYAAIFGFDFSAIAAGVATGSLLVAGILTMCCAAMTVELIPSPSLSGTSKD